MRDIETRDDIEALVRAFYEAAFADPLIGPIFTDVAKVDLNTHVPTVTNFWDSILFRTGTYPGGMMAKHYQVNLMTPLGEAEFGRWLSIWESTVASMYEGHNAQTVVAHAHRFANGFLRRMGHLRA